MNEAGNHMPNPADSYKGFAYTDLSMLANSCSNSLLSTVHTSLRLVTLFL